MGDALRPEEKELKGNFEILAEEEIEAALVSPTEAKKHAEIFGFTPDEALADAHFQINMLTSNFDELENRHEGLLQELAAANEEIERLKSQLSAAQPQHQLHTKIEQLEERNRRLCIERREERQKLEDELKNLRYSFESQGRRLAEKQARLDELESEEDEAQSSPQTILKEFPEVADLFNQLKSKRKKSKAEMADVRVILELLEEELLIE